MSSAGLITTVQPAASAGAILRVAIASGKFHGVIRKHGPTGCCDTIMRPVPSGFGAVAALDARGLLAEPAQELAAVGDLAARLGERLAHLDRHEQGEVLLALLQQVERAAQDLGALARGRRRPRRERLGGGIQRGLAVGGRGIRDLLDDLTRRGIVHAAALAARRQRATRRR